MIIRRLSECIGTDKEVNAPNGNWVSRRLLLKGDKAGFSMHDTIIYAGTETHIWYANHLEAVYCVSGKGELENKEDGKVYQIEDGFLYVLNGAEHHALRASEDMRLICVFSPALTGREVHDADGAYPLLED